MMNYNTVKTFFETLIFVFTAAVSNAQTADKFKMSSEAFEEGKPIPAKYTCAGTNLSPAISWTGAPEKTKSFAIIMDDPDAPMGTWVHWVMYNIPGTMNGFAEKSTAKELKATDGINSWEEKGYNGPCPPDGTHRYIFKLYALDTILNPKEGMSDNELMSAMKGHILAETKLIGLFSVQ
jgi:Raf kinase inhibitor-like YbhB/YbcL family protein